MSGSFRISEGTWLSVRGALLADETALGYQQTKEKKDGRQRNTRDRAALFKRCSSSRSPRCGLSCLFPSNKPLLRLSLPSGLFLSFFNISCYAQVNLSTVVFHVEVGSRLFFRRDFFPVNNLPRVADKFTPSRFHVSLLYGNRT